MLGSGMQFGRNYRGDDRFYVPFNGRRTHRNVYQQQQQKEQEEHVRRAQSEMVVARQSALKKEKKPVVVLPLSNLERFLQTVTPSVPARFLPKATLRGWRSCDGESQPYFELGDLWESFNEWSAYGAGVPLVLNGTNSVIQYYVPYLSGLQIYGDPTKAPVKSRRPGEDSDSDQLRNSSSDGSCDLNLEQGLDRLSLTDQHITRQANFCSRDGECLNSQGSLLFEYYERDPPYSREPLANKISDLCFQFPELKTLRSCDLLPSSWISVAWYPIYRIPMGPTLKDADPCFLTFHSLHTPVRAVPHARPPVLTYPSEDGGNPRISLLIFGMATYKFRGSLWSPKGGSEHQLVSELLQAADSWLRLLQVNHPDFQFFSRR